MLSAAIRPCRFAGPASGIMPHAPVTVSRTSTASPTAQIFGVVGLQMLVQADAAALPEFQPGVLCERGFRAHAQAKNHNIRFDALAALEHHDGCASRFARLRRFKRRNGISQVQRCLLYTSDAA